MLCAAVRVLSFQSPEALPGCAAVRQSPSWEARASRRLSEAIWLTSYLAGGQNRTGAATARQPTTNDERPTTNDRSSVTIP